MAPVGLRGGLITRAYLSLACWSPFLINSCCCLLQVLYKLSLRTFLANMGTALLEHLTPFAAPVQQLSSPSSAGSLGSLKRKSSTAAAPATVQRQPCGAESSPPKRLRLSPGSEASDNTCQQCGDGWGTSCGCDSSLAPALGDMLLCEEENLANMMRSPGSQDSADSHVEQDRLPDLESSQSSQSQSEYAEAEQSLPPLPPPPPPGQQPLLAIRLYMLFVAMLVCRCTIVHTADDSRR